MRRFEMKRFQTVKKLIHFGAVLIIILGQLEQSSRHTRVTIPIQYQFDRQWWAQIAQL